MKHPLAAIMLSVLLSSPAFSDEAKKPTNAKAATKAEPVDSDEDKDEASNKFDFDAATLEGKMKAPPGMMLKGRVEQNKNQMVQLRKDFRAELKKSSSANRAIKPKD